jgi:hypothetical protein
MLSNFKNICSAIPLLVQTDRHGKVQGAFLLLLFMYTPENEDLLSYFSPFSVWATPILYKSSTSPHVLVHVDDLTLLLVSKFVQPYQC